MRQIARFELLRLLYEQLVDRRGARAEAAVVQLIRRVADDYVKLHVTSKNLVDPRLDVVGVNERVSVGFQSFAAIQASSCSRRNIGTCSSSHVCSSPLEPYVARIVLERLCNRVRAVRVFAAIQTAPRQQTGQMRDADAEHLLCQDVIDPLLQIGNLVLQALRQPRW